MSRAKETILGQTPIAFMTADAFHFQREFHKVHGLAVYPGAKAPVYEDGEGEMRLRQAIFLYQRAKDISFVYPRPGVRAALRSMSSVKAAGMK